MADYYKEQIVKTDMDLTKRLVGSGISIALIVVVILFIPNFIISVGILALVFFLDNKYSKFFAPALLERQLELEYIATNSTFEIDTIINRANRRQEIEIDMKDVIWFSKMDSQKLLGHSHGAKVLDLSNIKIKDNTNKYVFVVTHKDKKTQVIFEPNEDMLNIFKVFVPKHAMEV